MSDALEQVKAMEAAKPCMCEDCGLRYGVASWGGPATTKAYTCDDCGGYVMDADETAQREAES